MHCTIQIHFSNTCSLVEQESFYGMAKAIPLNSRVSRGLEFTAGQLEPQAVNLKPVVWSQRA